jgi:hypothetical protein
VAGQAEHLGDLGVVPALGEQVMDRGVAFTGPGRQAAIAGVLAGGWPGRFAPEVAAGFGGLRITGFGGGFWQVGAAGDDGFRYRGAQVLPQVKTVGHLDGVRCSVPGALGVGAGPVAADDLHAGMVFQPPGQSAGLAVAQHVDGLAGVHVDQDGRVGMAAPFGEVIHAQHGDLANRRIG